MHFFTGTTNTANFSFAGFARVGNTSSFGIAAFPHINLNNLQIVPFSVVMHFLEPWLVTVAVPALIAGDVHVVTVCYAAERLL
jgi:hypothetical protein